VNKKDVNNLLDDMWTQIKRHINKLLHTMWTKNWMQSEKNNWTACEHLTMTCEENKNVYMLQVNRIKSEQRTTWHIDNLLKDMWTTYCYIKYNMWTRTEQFEQKTVWLKNKKMNDIRTSYCKTYTQKTERHVDNLLHVIWTKTEWQYNTNWMACAHTQTCEQLIA
jgi:hypothetical protein